MKNKRKQTKKPYDSTMLPDLKIPDIDLNIPSNDDFLKDIPSRDDLSLGSLDSLDDLFSHNVTCPQCGHKFKCKGYDEKTSKKKKKKA